MREVQDVDSGSLRRTIRRAGALRAHDSLADGSSRWNDSLQVGADLCNEAPATVLRATGLAGPDRASVIQSSSPSIVKKRYTLLAVER